MSAKSKKAPLVDVESWLRKADKINPEIDLETLEVEDDRFYRIGYTPSVGSRQKRVSYARSLKLVNGPKGMILSGMINIPVERITSLGIVDRLHQVRETKTRRAGKGLDLLKFEFERALGREVDSSEIKKRNKLPMMGD